MRRLVWVAVGIGGTLYAVRKAQQLRERYSPPAVVGRAVDDLGERASTFAERARASVASFGDDLRSAAAEREQQLGSALLAPGQAAPERGARPSRHDREQARTAARWGAEPVSGSAVPGQDPRVDDDDVDGDLPYSF
ncbi:hypothetical protein ATL41_0351 [Flavimobilis soli]|jgi:hypothetical protein|uniref:Uncharacterized protein n=1 Tax=Flavimobilis soli TaxID=442709 RepID=A0A2A9EAH6_9MICO|nr:hypothetical protein [Flavimobilis soli]PFG35656.1 hypothetical protein ATL41_0351 [Flavimobilis soli]